MRGWRKQRPEFLATEICWTRRSGFRSVSLNRKSSPNTPPTAVCAVADPRFCGGRRSRARNPGRALAKLHLWQRGTNLRAWLFTILHHRHVTHIRRSALEAVQADIGRFDQLLRLPPAQIDRLELRELERAIAELPASQRSAILLVGLEGLEYEEVAAMLEVPLGTVRSRVARARETLRIRIGHLPKTLRGRNAGGPLRQEPAP
jgi:RNA polymerase sigma factor (sigma-70 family)